MNSALRIVYLLVLCASTACTAETADEAVDPAMETEPVASAEQASCMGITVCNSQECWCLGVGVVDPDKSCRR